MKIHYLNPEGVPTAEQEIHGEIERRFSSSSFSKDWLGYASFALPLGGSNGSLDFDLVLVTHKDIIVIELKNWNANIVFERDGFWYQDDKKRGPSFTIKTDNSAKKLATALKRKLATLYVPYLRSCVFFHGKVDKFELPAEEMSSIFKNKAEFFKLAERTYYEQRFPSRRSEQFRQNFCLYRFDEEYKKFFLNTTFVKEREIKVGGYRKEKHSIFDHPRGLYKEYEGFGTKSTEKALIRDWHFATNAFTFLTDENRKRIFNREGEVYSLVEDLAPGKTSFLFRPLNAEIDTNPYLEDTQLFKLPSELKMLPNFFNSKLGDLDHSTRLSLCKTLLSHCATLHDLQIVHRDLEPHSVWLDSTCRICLTNFAVARIPENKTVGNLLEETKIRNFVYPEELEEGLKGTDFQKDVFCLGLLSYQLLYLEELPSSEGTFFWKAPSNPTVFGKSIEEVIKKSLSSDPLQRFSKAREFLDALNLASQPLSRELIDLNFFKEFSKKISRDEFTRLSTLIETEDKEVYVSEFEGNKCKVNIWYNIGKPENLKPKGQLILSVFLKKAKQIQTTSPSCLPAIKEFGIWRGDLFLVTEWAEGTTLLERVATLNSSEKVLSLASDLIEAIEKLHALEISHGDVHPGNIIVSPDGQIKFIDILDLRIDEDDPVNIQFLPENYRELPPAERDQWGVFKTLEKVLITEYVPEITFLKTYIALEKLKQIKSSLDLSPLKMALKEDLENLHKPPLPEFTCSIVDSNTPLMGTKLLTAIDNTYFVSVSPGKDNKQELRIFVSGQESQIKLVYSCTQNKVMSTSLKRNPVARGIEKRNNELEVNCLIKVREAECNDGDNFLEELTEKFPNVKSLIESKLAQLAKGTPSKPTNLFSEVLDTRQLKTYPSTSELWKEILKAEESAEGEVKILSSPRFDKDKAYVQIEGYEWDFEDDEPVSVEGKRFDGDWIPIGQLINHESTSELLVIHEIRDKSKLSEGKTIRLISQLAKMSFIRREQAINKILENKSPIENLPDYFDPNKCINLPVQGIQVDFKDVDFSSFNKDQQTAFKKVLSGGPITFLQGPPGTGKTFFIATLMDFLISTRRAQKILLTSQSHEAVNNSLERYARLCRAKGNPCSAVRIGNIKSVSEEIEEFYDSSLRNMAREVFIAEGNSRLEVIGKEIGLPSKFLREFIPAYKDFSNLLQSYRNSQSDRKNRLADTVLDKILDYQIPDDLITFDPEKDVPTLFNHLRQKNGFISESDYRKFIQLLDLSIEWEKALTNQRGNFTDFLIQTKKIVAGTLVGLGKKSYGICNQIYDWVIIDEAARANPTEIAVAIQSAKRILLVGDQAQLQPMYPDEVKRQLKEKFPHTEENYLFSSDFARVFEFQKKWNGASLLTQYRMTPTIGKVVSDCFYEGKLLNGTYKRPEYFNLLKSPPLNKELVWIDISDTETANEERTNNDSYKNSYEATLAIKLVYSILSQKDFVSKFEETNPNTPLIGIITLYAGQKIELNEKFDSQPLPDNLRKLVKIDTVDSYQGKENSIIILSTVRNNRNRDPGFLRVPNRINVALSRAKNSLFIFGSTKLWNSVPGSPLNNVLTSLRKVQGQDAVEILSSIKFSELL